MANVCTLVCYLECKEVAETVLSHFIRVVITKDNYSQMKQFEYRLTTA